MTIPITRPLIGKEELLAVRRALESGWVVQGPCVREFEEKLAGYTGASHAVATSSGTTALHAALAALGVGEGDEVIVPAFTWVSTANVVEHLGAKAVFCDIDLATYNVDVAALEAVVTARTVGVVPVHLFGLSANIEPIVALARRHGLWIVEDCACSLGGWYHGTHTGRFGEFGCFSFHPRKSITTGEGGMVVTDREDLADVARSLRNHGSATADSPGSAPLLSDYVRLGFNFRLTDIQGALGSAQMDRLHKVLERRRHRAALYDAALAGEGWLQTPVVPDGLVHGYQAYVCLFRPEEPSLANVRALNERRNALMAELDRRGIATRQGTHSPVLTRVYRERYRLRPEDFPNAVLADRLSLAVPLYPQLTDKEQEIVVAELRSAFRTVSCSGYGLVRATT
ncbi:MAG: DegT/DnrJ/EryC1/StrS family aminotransferase [Gaiellaceae bacterium]